MELPDKFSQLSDGFLKLNDNNVISIGVINKNKYETLTLTNHKQSIDDLFFDLGSVSKTYTAKLINKLVEKDVINLNDSISTYLPLKPGTYPSIKSLLTHTSGYKYFTPPLLLISRFLTHNYQKENIYKNITNEDVLKHIKPRKKRQYSYHYSDFNYAILAVIISKIYHAPFGDILSSFIKENLGYTKTMLSYQSPHNLSAYKGNTRLNYWRWDKNNPYLSGGGISANIDDVCAYLVNEMKDKSSPHFAWIKQNNSNKYLSFGCVGGFKSCLIFDSKHQLGAVVLTNSWGKKKRNARYLCNVLFSLIKRNKVKLN